MTINTSAVMDNVGLDLHKRESQLSILTDAGELLEQRIATTRERFTAILGPRPRSRILLEASSESERVARHLESLGHHRPRVRPDVRPHGGRTPASLYRPAPRPYPRVLPPQGYPGHFLVKKITTGGTSRFQHRLLFIANSLTNHQIGLDETDDGIWSIYFNSVLLVNLDERDYIIRR